MIIKPKTIDLNQDDLKLLVEQIVDFDSFNQNGYDLQSFFIVQEQSLIFDMLNVLTYPYLVKDLQVRAKVFDELVECEELRLLVENDSSLKGKARKDVGLKRLKYDLL